MLFNTIDFQCVLIFLLLFRRGTFTDEDSIQLYKPDGLVHTLDMGDEDEESVCPRWCPAIWTRYVLIF